MQKINKKVLVVKPSIDTRYNETKLTTHNFDSVDCMVVDTLDDINSMIEKYDVVVIDEGQFFLGLKRCIVKWLKKYNIHIIVGGLDGDYKQEPIGEFLPLIPHSDTCVKLTSLCMVCKDGTPGIFSHRYNESTSMLTESQILVGGAESYLPVCRLHLK